MDAHEPPRRGGRPRDQAIDAAVLAAAVRHLAQFGYEGMSVAAIAEEAGTTRQALYRRWPGKADLATAAIASLSRASERKPTDNVFADLVEELRAFASGVSRPNGVQMVGMMLLGSTEPELVRLYRDRIVTPRRERLRTILERARDQGLIDREADISLAVNAMPGSWYASELAGQQVPKGWPERIARLIWQGLGGTPPGD